MIMIQFFYLEFEGNQMISDRHLADLPADKVSPPDDIRLTIGEFLPG